MKHRILLCVTGSIAAYKVAELVRLFVKNGDEVRVVMTPAACEFVSPLTFQTLSRNPVYVEEFKRPTAISPLSRLRLQTQSPRYATVLPTTCSPLLSSRRARQSQSRLR